MIRLQEFFDRVILSDGTRPSAKSAMERLYISEAEQADIRVEHDLSLNNVVQGETTFVITEGNVFLKDEQGRIVKTIQAKAKGASADVREAESRSIAKLSQQLGKELVDVLF